MPVLRTLEQPIEIVSDLSTVLREADKAKDLLVEMIGYASGTHTVPAEMSVSTELNTLFEYGK